MQLFCGAPSVYDGGLQDTSVPHGLLHAEEYPETSAEGFFWRSSPSPEEEEGVREWGGHTTESLKKRPSSHF